MARLHPATWGVGALCLSLLHGCVVPAPPVEPREPNTTVPEGYDDTRESANSAELSWSEFFDPELRSLIDTALENNQELNIISLEIGITQNEVMARRGEYLPKVDFGAGAGLEKVGKYTSQGAADEADGTPEHLQNYFFGFFASWEVDVWKKLRNATKAATLRYMASIEGRRYAVTRLVAEIANAYYELLAFDSQLVILKQNIEIQQDALEVMKLQKQAGRVTELAVKRFEAEVFKNQSREFLIKQRIIETENRINFLVGRFPQPIARRSEGFIDLTPGAVEHGVPKQLLENRPDVRQAELELAAAQLDVEVAKARFYPSLEIDAALGYEAFGLDKLIDTPESLFYGLMADAFAPVLNRNAIKAAYFSKNAEQMQAVFEYERTILAAYNEVANQLAMIENLDQSFALRSQEVDRLTQSIAISSGLFTSARADYMEVLLTRRDALNAEIERVETKQQRLSATVDLYKALGGGWKSPAAGANEPPAST